MSVVRIAELWCDGCARRYTHADDGASGDTETSADVRAEAKTSGSDQDGERR